MPKDEPDPDDPMALVGVSLPVEDDASVQRMAACFIEEFLGLGHSPEEVLSYFLNPFYGGPHHAYLRLGHDTVAGMLREYAALRSLKSHQPIEGEQHV